MLLDGKPLVFQTRICGLHRSLMMNEGRELFIFFRRPLNNSFVVSLLVKESGCCFQPLTTSIMVEQFQ